MDDPNPVNSGRGFERLRAAGTEVLTGVCEEEAPRLNEAFGCWIRTKKPFLILKSAMTLDGQLALPQSQKKSGKGLGKRSNDAWITSEESRAEVHRMRHASDALLTGIGTILADDPLLTDRSGLPRRKRLLRVVLDSKLRLSPKSRIVKTSDDDLHVFTTVPVNSLKARKLQDAGVELIRTKTKKWPHRSAFSAGGTGAPRNLERALGSRPGAQRCGALCRHRSQTLSLLRAEDRRRKSRPFCPSPEAESSSAAQYSYATVSALTSPSKHICKTFLRNREAYSPTRRTAAPGMASFFRALSARFASCNGKIWMRIRIGISAATRKKSSPSFRVLFATLRITRS